MRLHGVLIHDDSAEAFDTWAVRLVITAVNPHWLRAAIHATCGYATSVIGCDAEAGLDQLLDPDHTPDARPGAALLFFNRDLDSLAAAVQNRVGQCLLTCPTAAVFDGTPQAAHDLQLPSDQLERIDLGRYLSFFGDGHQKPTQHHGHRAWTIPVMEGDVTFPESISALPAVAGGQFILIGRHHQPTLAAAQAAADAIAALPYAITPFPGGVCRAGSKIGSRYQGVPASTNHPFCPTLRDHLPAHESRLPPEATCAYEIIIDGLSRPAVIQAMCAGILAACTPTLSTPDPPNAPLNLLAIAASSFNGRLGKISIPLREALDGAPGLQQ